MARPKKPDGEVRENVLRIRLTDEERAALDDAAAAKHLETSTWARSELLSLALGRRTPGRTRNDGRT